MADESLRKIIEMGIGWMETGMDICIFIRLVYFINIIVDGEGQ